MVTPFDDDGALDLPAAVELARWLASHGSDGLVLCGSTGESSVLTDDEKVALWRAVAEAVTIPVIAGTGSNDTAHSVEHDAAGRRSPASTASSSSRPYYNRPSQAGIYEHFRVVAEAAGDLPVVLYDIPVRSGRRIDTADHAAPGPRGARHRGAQGRGGRPADDGAPGRAGAGGLRDLQRRRRHDAAAPGGRCGRRRSAWPRTGSGRSSARVIDAFLAGDLATAIAGNAELLDSFDFESTAEFPNPLPAKAALRALGLRVGQCRLPMGASTPELDAQAAKILAAVGPPAVTVAPLG